MTKVLNILRFYGFTDPAKAYQSLPMNVILNYIQRYYSENK